MFRRVKENSISYQKQAVGCFMSKKDNFGQIVMKFAQNSCQIRTNFVATECEVFIHTMGKSGEIFYEIRTNFVRISYESHYTLSATWRSYTR